MSLGTKRLTCAMVLVAVSLGPFAVTLTGAHLYFFDDLGQFSYPLRQYYADCLADGELPLWCPYLFAGYPLVADGQIGPFYPLNLLLFGLVPTPLAFSWAIALAFLTAAWGMYLYVARLTGSALGGLTAAVALVFSGFWVGHVVHVNLLQTVAPMPWAFYCLDRAYEGRRPAWLAGTAAAVATAALGGFPQMVQIMLAALAAKAAWNVLVWPGGPRPAGRLAWLAGAGAALAAGLALAAVQLLPTYELLQQGPRAGGITREMAAEVHLPPQLSATFLLPRAYGWHPPGQQGHFWGTGMAGQWEFLCYPGAGMLALALAGACPPWPNRHVPFYLIMAVVAMVAAFGPNTPLFDLIRSIPGFGYFRVYARFLMLVHFALAALAGVAAAQLAAGGGRRRAGVATALAFSGAAILLAVDPFAAGRPASAPAIGPYTIAALSALGVMGLAVAVRLRRLAACLLVVAGIEAAAASWDFVRATPTERALAEADTVRWLRTRGLEGRVLVRSALPQSAPAADIGRALGFNTPATFRLPAVSGYAPLEPMRMRYVEHGILRRGNGANLLDLLRVQAVVATPATDGPVNVQFGKTGVHWRGSVGPEALVVGRVVVAATPAGARLFIADGKADLVHTACVEDPPPTPLSDPSPAGRAEVLTSSDTELELGVQADRPALVVVSRRWDPGWRAWLDGEPVEVRRADYLLQGVFIPERGDYRLRLTYRPATLLRGAIGSAAAAVVVAAFLVVGVIRARRGAATTAEPSARPLLG